MAGRRFAGVAALAFACAGQAQAVPADLQAKADAYLKAAYPADGPGASVIIVDDGKTVYAGGRGLADVEGKTPITPQTVFRLGSITKQFSAALILQLVDEGKLSLDDPLSKFLPTFPQPGAGATVRQLLNHTVGVQSYTGVPGWMVEANVNRPYTTEQMIALFKDLPSPFKPGEAWDYNNSGYVLVGAVIEAVTGKPWHQAVAERLAAPLGLASIRYGVGEAAIARMAKGYTAGPTGASPATPLHMSVPHAAGALVGTVEDLAKWGQALHHGKVVQAASYALMTAPTKLPDGKTIPYGFGLGLAEIRGREAVGHGGGIFGFSTESIYIPQEDLYVAVFANSDAPATAPGIAMRRLAAIALGDPYPVFAKAEIAAATLAPLFGVYTLQGEGGGERLFFARGGKLFTRRKGAPELEVFAAGQDRFFYGPQSLTWFRVARDPGGTHVMEMHQDGADGAEKALRSGPVPPEPVAASVTREILARYVGGYTLGPVTAAVAMSESGGLTIQLTGQPAFPLRAVSSTEFRVDVVDARIVFVSEGAAVKRFILHQGGQVLRWERAAGQ